MKWYVPNIKEELANILNKKDTVYLDGKMTALYLTSSFETFMIDGIKYPYLQGKEQYRSIENKTFKIQVIGTSKDRYLQLREDYSKPIYQPKTISRMNKALYNTKLGVNIFTILLGIIMFLWYERKHSTIDKERI